MNNRKEGKGDNGARRKEKTERRENERKEIKTKELKQERFYRKGGGRGRGNACVS